MKKNFFFLSLLLLFLSAITIQSCTKDELKQATNDEPLTLRTAFTPTGVTVDSGTLVFNSISAMSAYQDQVALADPADVKAWEITNGVKTQFTVFNEVMNAQDSIEASALASVSTPAAEPSSTRLTNALSAGHIKWVTHTDATTYWDYGLNDASMASVANLNGLVKVDGQIYQFGNNSLVKVIRNGHFSQQSGLSSISTVVDNANYYSFDDALDTRDDCNKKNFSVNNEFRSAGSRKRVRCFVEGSSETVMFTHNPGSCYQSTPFGIRCKFILRTEAQRKNIWGNWRYVSDFSPSLATKDGDWTYYYWLYNSGCSGSYAIHTNGISTSPYVPLLNLSIPRTNNGSFRLNPDTGKGYVHFPNFGDRQFVECTLKITYNITATYSGISDWHLATN